MKLSMENALARNVREVSVSYFAIKCDGLSDSDMPIMNLYLKRILFK